VCICWILGTLITPQRLNLTAAVLMLEARVFTLSSKGMRVQGVECEYQGEVRLEC